MKIIDYLHELKNDVVSDIFLTEGKTAKVRKNSFLVDFGETELLKRTDFLGFFDEFLPKLTWESLQDELDLDLGLSLSVDERFRLNLGFEQGAITLVARKVPSGAMHFDQLSLPPILEKLIQEPRGLILVTGATGSGKSTTTASMIHYLNSNYAKHIVTIEDPIEYIHKDSKSRITQREVGSDTKSFSTALKSVVRQSPDVIFIGEMRDLDTIKTAMSAAMTGHLVISTLHTVNAEQTIERMINYFPESQQTQFALDLSISLRGIVSQRLVPKKGNDGLIPAVEVLVNTPLVSKLIARQEVDEISEVMKSAAADGMISFNRSIINMVKSDQISGETAVAVADNREEMKLLLEGMETGIDTLRAKTTGEASGDASIKSLLKSALYYSASDMLFSAGNPPILRINGELLEMNVDKLSSADTRNLLFSVLNRKQRAEFEQKKEIDFALSTTIADDKGFEKTYRFRVNGFYQKGTISCALRVINQVIPNPTSLGLASAVVEMANKPHGLVLITGPTGHGKSTTMACMIDQINNSRSCHIITIEDPIEYVHKNKKAIIEQRELYADTHSYANAMKYILRQDPDVILIGEMRDPETIAAALTAAETGHLVLATLHTNDAIQTVDRIIDSFPPHHQNQIRSQLAACLVGVVAQRLLPRKDKSGRVAVFELLMGTIASKSLIRDGKTHQMRAIMETAQKDGMITMDKALKDLYDQGVISRETVLGMALDKNII
ncbi:MAG: PilT/PilU family type 4a pilus ATPase [Lentisphaeraceae bacterium]|nr:PilT/PilU family type 4a pilus ATPase [Lentisphaeraceae bacterium]